MKRPFLSARGQLLCTLFLGLCAGPLPAATFNIANGDVTGLIAAIDTANTNGESDVINLATGGTYIFSSANNATNGGNALPVLLNDVIGPDLTIHGNGSDFEITGNGSFRFFQVNAAVTIDNLFFQHGSSSEFGGAIRVSATLNTSLTLANCSFTSNKATSGGGAIADILNANVVITNCAFSGNQAGEGVFGHDDPGGAILNQSSGTITVTNCAINANVATGKLGGGGIANTGAGTVNITATNFGGNVAGRNVTGTLFNDASGGAIGNTGSGTVMLSGGFLTQNIAADGGAVYNAGGAFTATDAIFAANSATPVSDTIVAVGGAIYNSSGTVTIQNCTINSNSATAKAGTSQGAYGGGIYHTASVTISGSTISRNTARGGDSANSSTAAANGGGIWSGGPLTLTNCTIAGNTAQGGNSSGNNAGGQAAGGGIYLTNNPAYALTATTIATNTAAGGTGNPIAAGLGGGVYATSGNIGVKNSLIANNTAQPADVAGNFASLGYNLIGKADGSTGFTAPTDLVGTNASPLDPKLDPNGTQDNGGPTLTIALLVGSPAIDHGTSAGPNGNLPTDQRGLARTFDDPNIPNAAGGDGADIGAFEVQGAAPTPTPTPSPAPATLANVSTRMRVETGDNVLIGGFIVSGTQPKRVIISALGPSLSQFFSDALADPVLELYSGNTLLESNDNWVDSPNKQEIIATTLAPGNNAEPAIIRTLPANNSQYTAIVRGVNNGTGVGVVQVFDLDRTVDSKLANISTRGSVQTGDNVMIAGFIVAGATQQKVIIIALGPSLPVPGSLADPTLELHDSNGSILQSNDNWIDSPDKQAIIDSSLAPPDNLESALIAILPSNGAQYTAIVRGVGGTTGVAVVEVFALN